MICFPIHWQLWCAFWQKNDMVFQLILLTYSWKHIIRIRTERIKKSHKSDVSLRWYAFVCGFGSDVLFTIDHLRSISFFCQNAHHDWLTKEYISNWFLVKASKYIISTNKLFSLILYILRAIFQKPNDEINPKSRNLPYYFYLLNNYT